jgi:hypothetical protein
MVVEEPPLRPPSQHTGDWHILMTLRGWRREEEKKGEAVLLTCGNAFP